MVQQSVIATLRQGKRCKLGEYKLKTSVQHSSRSHSAWLGRKGTHHGTKRYRHAEARHALQAQRIQTENIRSAQQPKLLCLARTERNSSSLQSAVLARGYMAIHGKESNVVGEWKLLKAATDGSHVGIALHHGLIHGFPNRLIAVEDICQCQISA